MPKMLSKIVEFMQAQGMPASPTPILVAVSGGADSVALLTALHQLGYKLAVAHCNHGLRQEALAEEEWVRSLAGRLNCPFFVRRFTPADFAELSGDGLQQAARKLRYAFWEELMAQRSFSYCATAHHADDQLETQIMSFFRGNGPKLLHTIPAVRGPYLRPLLALTKADLLQWLADQGQDWCHDKSNDHDEYQRNLVRNKLIPLLGTLQPAFRERFATQAQRYSSQQEWFSQHFRAVATRIVGQERGVVSLDLAACAQEMGEAHVAVFVTWWLDEQGFEGTQIAELLHLLHAKTGATRTYGARVVLRDRNHLRIHPRAAGEESILILDLDQDQEIQWSGHRLHITPLDPPTHIYSVAGAQSHWLDADQLRGPFSIRPWRIGDRIAPYGMQGSKLVSDILIDQKQDRIAKANFWVLEDEQGIVLLAGYRVAARVALTSQTKRCIRLDHYPSV